MQNINTANLPDGSSCFVTSTQRLYRFRKFSTLAAVADTIIVPSSGGGRWVLEGTTSGALGLFVAATDENTTDASVSGSWLGAQSAAFALQRGAGAWSLTAAACILTYLGPPASFLVDVRATLTFPGGETPQIGIDHSSDLTGTDAGFAEGIQFADVGLEGSVTLDMSSQRIVTINPTEVIQPRFRLSGATDLIIERLTLSAIPI